ncbi:MAG: radical SAM protein [Thermoplasmataceae archaeon]
MLITEIFKSIQGEGPFTGIPMAFVRTNRCNLRCNWCDSTYTFQGGTEIKLQDIIKQVESLRVRWVCFTGGEPLIQREAPEFVRALHERGYRVLIETSGSISIRPYLSYENVYIDMDIKTPSSGESESLLEENLTIIRGQDYVKFVIADESDYEFAREFLMTHSIPCEALIQPAWKTDPQWIAERLLSDGLNARFMLQTHKIIWGERRGV